MLSGFYRSVGGAALAAGLLVSSGCGKRETVVMVGDREGIIHIGNGAEPKDLDPHTVTDIPAARILFALMEGLVGLDGKTLKPIPATAERWEVSPDGLIYTFHLRPNATWSNGDPVKAGDFLYAFKRILSPAMGAKYAYMLYPLKNAEAFHRGTIKDFVEVGARAPDDRTLVLTLGAPTPYFLGLLAHQSWFPVHPATIKAFGAEEKPGTGWTRPGNFVGNGPFVLKDWAMNTRIVLEKNPKYYDAAKVRLNRAIFYPIDATQSEERAFRGGQLHVTETLPPDKIAAYRKERPECLRTAPYLGTYFYYFNTKRKPLDDARVRRALAMTIDRKSLVENVTKGGQKPAYAFTPPGVSGYEPKAAIGEDIAAARKLLAEAGYPDGRGFPKLELLYNTSENHRSVAQAVQSMWKKALNIDVALVNREWKVCLDAQTRGDYDISRGGWIGDYDDPNTFLDLWVTGGGNNRSGWSNAEYDRLIAEAARTADTAARFALLQKAEALLLDQTPIAPIYAYSRVGLVRPSVKGWNDNILDYHPLKEVYLEPSSGK